MARTIDKYVRRYTTLASAFDTLVHRRIALLSPAKWEDTNDVDFMELYRVHTGAASVVALCFAKASETFHHWAVFTKGMEGVCVEFDRRLLEQALRRANPNIIAKPVEYLLVKQLEMLGPDGADKLPFVKRDGYSDEREWRIVVCCEGEPKLALEVPIELDAITRIILNPWMPPSLVKTTRDIMRDLVKPKLISIESSRLTNSARWKAAGKRMVG